MRIGIRYSSTSACCPDTHSSCSSSTMGFIAANTLMVKEQNKINIKSKLISLIDILNSELLVREFTYSRRHVYICLVWRRMVIFVNRDFDHVTHESCDIPVTVFGKTSINLAKLICLSAFI